MGPKFARTLGTHKRNLYPNHREVPGTIGPVAPSANWTLAVNCGEFPTQRSRLRRATPMSYPRLFHGLQHSPGHSLCFAQDAIR